MAKLSTLRLYRPTPRAKRLVLAVLIGLAVVLTFSWRLSDLPPGLADFEKIHLAIARGPVNNPEFLSGFYYYLPLKAVLFLTTQNILATRLVSLGASALGLVVFYLLARNWWSRLAASLATILAGTSYWFLLVSRTISPISMSLLLTCSLLLLFLQLKQDSKKWQIALSGFLTGLCFYLPPLLPTLGIIITVAGMIYSRRQYRGKLPITWLIYVATLLVALIPLIVGVAQTPSLITQVFGLNDISFAPMDILHHTFLAGRTIIWDGGQIIGLLPGIGLLDIGSLGLITLGFLRMASTPRLQRSRLLVVAFVICAIFVLIQIQPPYAYGYILPIVYLLSARGINQLLSEWQSRFPTNDVAKITSLFAVIGLVIVVSLYNLSAYYQAWGRSELIESQYRTELQ